MYKRIYQILGLVLSCLNHYEMDMLLCSITFDLLFHYKSVLNCWEKWHTKKYFNKSVLVLVTFMKPITISTVIYHNHPWNIFDNANLLSIPSRSAWRVTFVRFKLKTARGNPVCGSSEAQYAARAKGDKRVLVARCNKCMRPIIPTPRRSLAGSFP